MQSITPVTLPNNYLDLAVKCAKDASLCRFKHGCVIFNKKGVVSTGFNKVRPNPILRRFGYEGCFLHAESDAILKVRDLNLSHSSLLVIRLNDSGKLSNSKPCSGCMAMIDHVGIKYIYYSNRNGDIECLNLNVSN